MRTLKHKFENVIGSVSLDELEIISVSKPKYASVDLCIKSAMNIPKDTGLFLCPSHLPFAGIKLYNRDRFVNAKYCFESAVILGKEIERRWQLQTENEANKRMAIKYYKELVKLKEKLGVSDPWHNIEDTKLINPTKPKGF